MLGNKYRSRTNHLSTKKIWKYCLFTFTLFPFDSNVFSQQKLIQQQQAQTFARKNKLKSFIAPL